SCNLRSSICFAFPVALEMLNCRHKFERLREVLQQEFEHGDSPWNRPEFLLQRRRTVGIRSALELRRKGRTFCILHMIVYEKPLILTINKIRITVPHPDAATQTPGDMVIDTTRKERVLTPIARFAVVQEHAVAFEPLRRRLIKASEHRRFVVCSVHSERERTSRDIS